MAYVKAVIDNCRWRFKVMDFDEDVQAGKDLNNDLKETLRRYGKDHIQMEVEFPQDYPRSPFFMRVVYPRMVMYSGALQSH